VTAVTHPDVHARNVAYAAALILNLTVKVDEHTQRVLTLHRAGKHPAAQVARGQRDRYDHLLLDTHQKADVAYGADTVRRALTAERRRRKPAGKAA
jgi:hypothetical protein